MSFEAPRLISANDGLASVILSLIQRNFAYMDGRIDPPSSMHRLSEGDITKQMDIGEVWCVGNPPFACMFLTPKIEVMYLGKLAVDAERRGFGLAADLVEMAVQRAAARGFSAVDLETRVELTDNHAMFEKVGFRKIAETAHEGYDRPTSFTYRKEFCS